MTEPPNDRIEAPASRDGLARLLDQLEHQLETRYPGNPHVLNARLVAEELLVNCLEYGRAGERPGALLRALAWTEDEALHLRLEDPGDPWNPFEQALPDVEADIEERPIGGLGVFLVEELTSAAHYRRDGDYNVVEVTLDPNPEDTAQ